MRERWELWLGNEAAEFDLDHMQTTLLRIMNMEDLTDDRITMKNAALRTVYLNEKAKLKARSQSIV